MTDEPQAPKNNSNPWGSEPIRGLNYDYLDITEPPEVTPEPVMPEPQSVEFNSERAEDFYKRIRGKIVQWANGAGAGKATTDYILLVPDIMALFVRMMGDPRVAAQLKAEIAAASAYIIIPIDLMPEAALGPAGLIDDVIVGMIALNRVVTAMGSDGRKVALELWDGDADLFDKMEEVLAKADQFVTGTVWNGIKKFVGEVATEARDTVNRASTGRKKSKGPIIEGSARPILPPGVTVEGEPNERPPRTDDKRHLPPNERG